MSNRKVFCAGGEVDFEAMLGHLDIGIAFELNQNPDTNVSTSEDAFISEYSRLYFEKFGIKNILTVEYWF